MLIISAKRWRRESYRGVLNVSNSVRCLKIIDRDMHPIFQVVGNAKQGYFEGSLGQSHLIDEHKETVLGGDQYKNSKDKTQNDK